MPLCKTPSRKIETWPVVFISFAKEIRTSFSQNTHLPCRESLPFQHCWNKQDVSIFVLSRNVPTPEQGEAPALAYTARFHSSYRAKSQDTAISDKGKTCFETDSPTHCLILVFWYFRYRNSFHLLTALCGRCFITPLHTRAHSVTPAVNFTPS